MLPDDTPFGPDLARAAVALLKRRAWYGALHAIVRSHRDYTGHGLFYEKREGGFYISASEDGIPRGDRFVSFEEEQDFTEWLASQSDLTLSGDPQHGVFRNDHQPGNQRITRAFLREEIARLSR